AAVAGQQPRSSAEKWRSLFSCRLDACIIDWSLNSDRHSRQGYNELDSLNVLALEPSVVGDEKIYVCACGAGQLNAVGRLQRLFRSQSRIYLCRFDIEGNHGRHS